MTYGDSMVTTNIDATYGHSADRVQRLHIQVSDLLALYSGQSTDARRVNLNNILMATGAAQATLRLIQWAFDTGGDPLVKILKLSRPEYLSFVSEDMLRSSKHFLLLEGQFQIEALFYNILRALGVAKPPRGFYKIASAVVNEAALSQPADKVSSLNVAALMRNSMHANGVHSGSTIVRKTINGLDYVFEPGKPVSCAHWAHVTTALSASIGIVDEILRSQKVSACRDIPDLYSTLV
jgi:hypothetical protein